MLDNKIIKSLTDFIFNNNLRNQSLYDIYNKWSSYTKTIVAEENDVMWILCFIEDLCTIKNNSKASNLFLCAKPK